MQRLAEQLLLLARVEGEGFAVRSRPVDLDDLVDNAMRHARAHVRIAIDGRDGHAEILVEDDGPGIPGDHRDDVLRAFTRLDDARDRDAGGAGLGLAITNDIVTAHGGTVTIGASDLGGAALRIVVPTDPASLSDLSTPDAYGRGTHYDEEIER